MSKNLKIIIAAITLIAISALGFFILPKIIPYTPPTPNIVKTDQGSFELRLTNNYEFSDIDFYTYEKYLEYESYAKNYYSRISKVVKKPNLVINQDVIYPGDGLLSPTISLSIDNRNNSKLFEAIYTYNYNLKKFDYYSFVESYIEGNPKKISLDELLQTPEYQNLKSN